MDNVIVRDRKMLKEFFGRRITIPQDLYGKPCVICVPQTSEVRPGWSSMKNYHVKIILVTTVHYTEKETGHVVVDSGFDVKFSGGFTGYFRKSDKNDNKISGRFLLPKENSFDRDNWVKGDLILSW